MSAERAAGGIDIVFDPERSHGAYLFDRRTGREYLDFFCFRGSRALGFNHEGFQEPDFLARLTQAALHKPTSSDIETETHSAFRREFLASPLKGGFAQVFLADAEERALEGALQAALQWKHRRNRAAGRDEPASTVIQFRQAAGRALSVATELATPPSMGFPFDGVAEAAVTEAERVAREEIAGVFEEKGHTVAAIVVEPIQGTGGDNHLRPDFLRELRALCDVWDALLVFDEIETGFGATGAWWDFEHHDVRPDVLCFGRKAQVCGFAATDRMDHDDFSGVSSVFGGSLVDMERGRQVIVVVEREDLIANANSMGGYMLKLLRELGESNPSVENVRGQGLWAAFDLKDTAARDRLVNACFAEQLLVAGSGTRSVCFRPSLDIDADSVARAMAQLEAGIRRAEK
ncbi:MAG: aminotransferase class III-fold pyridoxal phosphate-dependent enzyme [Myxococcota bacterium]